MASLRFYLVSGLVLAFLGLGATTWALQASNARLRAQNAGLAAAQLQAQSINRVVGNALVKTRERNQIWKTAYQELAHVKDDNSCRSPAIDRAFDILRRNASQG